MPRLAPPLLLIAAACQQPPTLEPQGRWVDGDVHVHATGGSNDTDAFSSPSQIAAVARARGLDFLILTDHSNATGSMSFGDDVENHPNLGPEFPYRAATAALTVEGAFVMMDGNEISPIESLTTIGRPRGHVGCLPKPGDPFGAVPASFAFVDRPPGAVTGGAGVAACHGVGGFAVINHPYTFATWTAYDWTSYEYDAIEVWNGGLAFDAWDLKGMQAWWCDRSLGRSVAPVGASDCHRVGTPSPGTLTDPALGVARTLVFVTNLTAEGVAAGLASGRTVAHDDAARLEVWASAGSKALLPGDRAAVPAGTVATFHLRGRADRPAQVQILSVGMGDCTDQRAVGLQGEAVVRQRREGQEQVAEGAFDVTLEVTLVPGRDYAARLWHALEGEKYERGLALSNAIHVQ